MQLWQKYNKVEINFRSELPVFYLTKYDENHN